MKGLSGLVALSAAMGISMSVSATEIHVMSGGAPKEVFALLTPKFEQQTGNKVKFTYAVITALREKLVAGEKADVLVMPVPLLDGFAKDGKLRADSRATFGSEAVSTIRNLPSTRSVRATGLQRIVSIVPRSFSPAVRSIAGYIAPA